jgi:hypothetical protein
MRPSPGWSFFTPTTTLPRCVILSNVGEPATVTPVAGGCETAGEVPPGLPDLPHAVIARALIATTLSNPTLRVRIFIVVSCPLLDQIIIT